MFPTNIVGEIVLNKSTHQIILFKYARVYRVYLI